MPKNKFNIITLGSATVDLILKSSQFKVVKNKSFSTGFALCEIYDSKINIEDFTLSTGGGSTNVASSLSHFGMNVYCVSKLGKDLFASLVLKDLKKYGVDTSNVKLMPNKKTAVSVILTSKEGGRTVMIHRGACENLSLQTLSPFPKASWAYVCNLGGTFKNVRGVIDYLNSSDYKIFWNPGLNELKNFDTAVLKKVDILSLNLEEASSLANIPQKDIKKLLSFFSKFKNLLTLITLGSKGAFAIDSSEILHTSSLKVDVVNSLGAGDAFGSAFLYAYLKYKDKKVALEYGIKNALSIIQQEPAKGEFLKTPKAYPDLKIKRITL